MTDRRTTITRGWRPHGAPARRVDDFVEAQAEPARQVPQPVTVRQVDRRHIGSRLENWARLYHQMRGTEQPHDRRIFDQADAQLLERMMPALLTFQRCLLWWCYVKRETPEGACLMLGIANKPAVQFVAAFVLAQSAIEALVASHKG